jgi:hypothetical protein
VGDSGTFNAVVLVRGKGAAQIQPAIEFVYETTFSDYSPASCGLGGTVSTCQKVPKGRNRVYLYPYTITSVTSKSYLWFFFSTIQKIQEGQAINTLVNVMVLYQQFVKPHFFKNTTDIETMYDIVNINNVSCLQTVSDLTDLTKIGC